MLRSLPSLSRLVPAVLIALVIATILFQSLSLKGGQCDENGQCSAEELNRPLTRTEFYALEQKVKQLEGDIEHLKHQEPQKQLAPEEQLWESRRTECGEGVVRNIDYQHSVLHEKFWASPSKELWTLEQKKWQSYMSSLSPYPAQRYSGRGIVMLGGNAKTLNLILVTLRMLRSLNSTLPVEVWHLPGEISSVDDRALRDLGATPRDLGGEDVLLPVHEIRGREKNFQLKVAAWVNSRFEEIIGLDSDVMPVRDPSYLFETEEYKRMGQIFWPDWWKTHRNNPIWDIVDSPCKDEWEQESGEVVYNKRQNWDALMLAAYFSENSEFYFQLLNGDKDLLRFAHKALKRDYYMARFPTAGGAIFENRFCGFAFVFSPIQYDPSDRVVFVHANLLKEMPRSEFNVDHEQGVFRVFKDYTVVHGHTWLHPQMQTSQFTYRPCMELFSGNGEPDIRERPFEELPGLQDFNGYYRRNGGVGGGIQ